MTSVWNASDAATNGLALSNGGLTVTNNQTSTWVSIRSTLSHTAGKVYIEFFANAAAAQVLFGLADTGFVPTSYLGSSVYSVGIWANNGANYPSAGFTSNYTITYTPMNNDVIALAVDFTAGSIWLGANNVWLNGNPATGSLPILSFVPATVGALFPALSFLAVETWTLQPTAISQTYAPPSGFSAWDPAAHFSRGFPDGGVQVT